jgi:DNA-binding CsgD family transcriptional regulator
VEYLPPRGANSEVVERRLLQVCLDFAPTEGIELSGEERKIYELFLEKLTAVEIASALSISVQSVIETLERLKCRGCKIDLQRLIDRERFALIRSELLKKKGEIAAHKAVRDSELAEVMLVARIISASGSDTGL